MKQSFAREEIDLLTEMDNQCLIQEKTNKAVRYNRKTERFAMKKTVRDDLAIIMTGRIPSKGSMRLTQREKIQTTKEEIQRATRKEVEEGIMEQYGSWRNRKLTSAETETRLRDGGKSW